LKNTEKRHQNNVTKFFYFAPLSAIKISGYASSTEGKDTLYPGLQRPRSRGPGDR